MPCAMGNGELGGGAQGTLGWLNGDSPLASPSPLDHFYNICVHPALQF